MGSMCVPGMRRPPDAPAPQRDEDGCDVSVADAVLSTESGDIEAHLHTDYTRLSDARVIGATCYTVAHAAAVKKRMLYGYVTGVRGTSQRNDEPCCQPNPEDEGLLAYVSGGPTDVNLLLRFSKKRVSRTRSSR